MPRLNEIITGRCVQVHRRLALLEMRTIVVVRQKLLPPAANLEMRNEFEKANYQEYRGKIIVIRAEITQMVTLAVTTVMQVVLGQLFIIPVKREFCGEIM